MIRKRLDRYVSRSFLVPFFGCLLLIFGLYASFDIMKRIDEFQRKGLETVLPAILSYYGYLFPVFVLETVPAVILVAAGWALVRMSSRRELLALKASGISLHRLVLPVFLWTLLISAAVFWARESVVPEAAKRKELIDRELDEKVARNLFLEDEEYGFKLFVRAYDFSDNTMSRVSIVELHPHNVLKTTIRADAGEWVQQGGLHLEKVQIDRFGEDGTPQGAPEVLTTLQVPTSLTQFHFAEAQEESISFTSLFLTLRQLAERIRDNPGIPQFRVMFHSRLASSFSALVLLLFGIPLLVGFGDSMSSRFLATVVCMAVAACYYVVSFVFASMGGTGAINPALAGWLPTLIGAPLGVWLFESMRT